MEILNGSSTITRPITTNTAVTPGWPELLRLNGVAYPRSQSLDLIHIPGRHIATAYFRLQLPPELQFDTHTLPSIYLGAHLLDHVQEAGCVEQPRHY